MSDRCGVCQDDHAGLPCDRGCPCYDGDVPDILAEPTPSIVPEAAPAQVCATCGDPLPVRPNYGYVAAEVDGVTFTIPCSECRRPEAEAEHAKHCKEGTFAKGCYGCDPMAPGPTRATGEPVVLLEEFREAWFQLNAEVDLLRMWPREKWRRVYDAGEALARSPGAGSSRSERGARSDKGRR